MVQGFLGSNSTFYLFLLNRGQVRGKGGLLVSVRKVEAVNQSVYRSGCDKARGRNAMGLILDP